MKISPQKNLLLLSLVLLAAPALAWQPPAALSDAINPHGYPMDVNNMNRTKNIVDDAAKEAKKNSTNVDLGKKAAEYGKANAKTGKDMAKNAKEFYDALTEADKGLEPNYQPPGAPQVPSACMENKDCKPCFEKAQGNLNKTRINLEKVRAHYKHTHRFTAAGKALLTAAGQAGGTIAGLGANAENMKVDKSLAEFDTIVRNKNAELMAKVQENLKEIGACEAKFYKNDDWYNRYGFVYYQFLLAAYSY